jgi:hypothetical protein
MVATVVSEELQTIVRSVNAVPLASLGTATNWKVLPISTESGTAETSTVATTRRTARTAVLLVTVPAWFDTDAEKTAPESAGRVGGVE